MSYATSTFAAGEEHVDTGTPLLKFSETSRVPFTYTPEEMLLYRDLHVGVDGKGGLRSTLVQAKQQTICVLKCSLVAHAVVLIPQLFISFVRASISLSILNFVLVLNLVCHCILMFSEWYQVRALRAPLTFQSQHQRAERVATGLTAAFTCAAAVWICVVAVHEIRAQRFLLAFSTNEAVVLLVVSGLIVLAAVSGLVCVAVLVLPKYRHLWAVKESCEAGKTDCFGNLRGNHVANSVRA